MVHDAHKMVGNGIIKGMVYEELAVTCMLGYYLETVHMPPWLFLTNLYRIIGSIYA